MYMSHDTSTPCHTNTLTSPHNIMTVAMFIGVCVGEVCCWCMCVCSTISQDTCISPYNIKTHSHHPILSKYIHITLYYQNTYIKTHAYHPIISKHVHITLYYQNTFTSPYNIQTHSHHPILSKYIHQDTCTSPYNIKTHSHHPILSKHIHINLYHQDTCTSPYIIKIHTSRHIHMNL